MALQPIFLRPSTLERPPKVWVTLSLPEEGLFNLRYNAVDGSVQPLRTALISPCSAIIAAGVYRSLGS